MFLKIRACYNSILFPKKHLRNKILPTSFELIENVLIKILYQLIYIPIVVKFLFILYFILGIIHNYMSIILAAWFALNNSIFMKLLESIWIYGFLILILVIKSANSTGKHIVCCRSFSENNTYHHTFSNCSVI